MRLLDSSVGQSVAWGLLLVSLVSGCRRAEDLSFVSSEQVLALPAEVQTALRAELRDLMGTMTTPVALAAAVEGREREVPLKGVLARGQGVYQMRCAQCHGVTGDGNGPTAKYMYPKPRDYRKGAFKFTSTQNGSRPVKTDLMRTIMNGVRGTSMPDFKLLDRDDLDAVVEYVIYLSQRGQLEEQLAMVADFEGTVNKELIEGEGVVDVILDRWRDAQGEQIVPFTPMPVFTEDHVRRGKEAFLSKGCSKCHGDDGRGQTPDNLRGDLKDIWGETTRAADLTSGMLHGGPTTIDIYRRIYSGINGTPMPAFANALQSEPDTLWDLVAYVQFISGRRRAGENPPPGTMAPYIPAQSTDTKGESGE